VSTDLRDKYGFIFVLEPSSVHFRATCPAHNPVAPKIADG